MGKQKTAQQRKANICFSKKKNKGLPRGEETHCTSQEWTCTSDAVCYSLGEPKQQTTKAESRRKVLTGEKQSGKARAAPAKKTTK